MKSIFYFTIVILLALSSALPVAAVDTFSCADVTEIPTSECEALVALYNSTNGADWTDKTNWLVTNTPSNWYRVKVTNGHVQKLELWANNLKGHIPPELGNLTSLEELHFGGNTINGTIPHEFGELTNLWFLTLWFNQLSGSIPPEFGNLTSLQNLQLNNNQLSGDIPSTFISLVNLGGLSLDFNMLNVPPGYPDPGNPLHVFLQIRDTDWHLNQYFTDCSRVTEIPQSECDALVALYNSTNGATWTINANWLVVNTPSYWYGMTVESGHVIGLNISSNNLVGSLPGGLGNLTNLKELVLGRNQLNGSIPAELGNLTNLKELVLWRNQLNGSIPVELGNLTNLTDLDLEQNQLSGSIPATLGNLVNLQRLFLDENQLSGSIPVELGNLTNLTGLYLDRNQLSGSIPLELGNLSNLTSLDLQLNQLSGTIPPELGDFTNLKYLYLAGNKLGGNIPPELGNLTNLKELVLWRNQLNGSIPIELVNLTNLKDLSLGGNQLSGSIPVELGDLTNLIWLELGSNQLSGTIPPELGDLTNLTWLVLDSNQLSGSIPSELGNLTNLKHLWLQNNRIIGDIPSTLTNLINLYDPVYYDGLDLDYNMLNVPVGYPDPLDPLQVFLYQKDPDWQLYQGFRQLIGAGGGELTSLDGRTNFVVPAGAVITDTTFTFMPLPVPRHPTGLRAFANNSFDLSAEDGAGNPVTTFNLPITVTLSYTDIIGPEGALGLYYWDGAVSNWTDAASTCPGGAYTRDLVGNTLALPICHLTEFGLFGNPLLIFMPVVRR